MQPFWHTYIYTVWMYIQSFNWYTLVRSITTILSNTYTSQKLLLCRLQWMFTSPSYYIMFPTQNAYTVGWAQSALKGCRQFQTLKSLLSKLQQEAIFPHWQCELHCMQALLCVLCSLPTHCGTSQQCTTSIYGRVHRKCYVTINGSCSDVMCVCDVMFLDLRCILGFWGTVSPNRESLWGHVISPQKWEYIQLCNSAYTSKDRTLSDDWTNVRDINKQRWKLSWLD